MEALTMGIDLGQRRDFTAIVVDERGPDDTHVIRGIERPRLGTPYPKIIKRVEAIRDRLEKKSKVSPTIYVDATGVGRPVVDEFTAKGVDVHAVTIVAGDSVSEEGREIHVGKLALISRLEVLLADGRIEWNGRTPLGKKLTEELHRFQLKVSKAGSLQLEAEKSFHDDLVIALALAVFVKSSDHPGITIIDMPVPEASGFGSFAESNPKWSRWP